MFSPALENTREFFLVVVKTPEVCWSRETRLAIPGRSDLAGPLELRYFRDIDGREVDFVLTENRKPIWLVEAKWADSEVDRGLRYLKARFPKTEAWQITAAGKKDYVTPDGIHVTPALAFLSRLI